jgi:hypothetical protein
MRMATGKDDDRKRRKQTRKRRRRNMNDPTSSPTTPPPRLCQVFINPSLSPRRMRTRRPLETSRVGTRPVLKERREGVGLCEG